MIFKKHLFYLLENHITQHPTATADLHDMRAFSRIIVYVKSTRQVLDSTFRFSIFTRFSILQIIVFKKRISCKLYLLCCSCFIFSTSTTSFFKRLLLSSFKSRVLLGNFSHSSIYISCFFFITIHVIFIQIRLLFHHHLARLPQCSFLYFLSILSYFHHFLFHLEWCGTVQTYSPINITERTQGSVRGIAARRLNLKKHHDKS